MTPDLPVMADYAIDATHSRGRQHPEPPDPIRDGFALDRYRVVHCTAFRRLEYKTQVLVTYEGDHYRTRLTHSLEVAHLAAELARALHVNDRLAEVVGLAHDLGHTPFGHAGESALAEAMRDHGGFEHNRQSLRVVEYLEHPYPDFRGLNLMAETRECLAAHATQYDRPDQANAPEAQRQWPPLEGQLNNVADRLAYDSHDLEDALGAGLIGEGDVSGLALWDRTAEPIRWRHPDLLTPAIRRPVLDALVREVMADVVDASRRRIDAADPHGPDDVRGADALLVGPSVGLEADLAELEAFLLERVYRHPRVTEMDALARRLVGEVFEAFVADPSRLPDRFADRIDEQGRHSVVCDYVAGMTDRFLEAEHRRLCG